MNSVNTRGSGAWSGSPELRYHAILTHISPARVNIQARRAGFVFGQCTYDEAMPF